MRGWHASRTRSAPRTRLDPTCVPCAANRHAVRLMSVNRPVARGHVDDASMGVMVVTVGTERAGRDEPVTRSVIATADPPPVGIANPIHAADGASSAGYAGAL